MSSVNKVILVGNLGGDPEVRAVGETSVANFSLATTEVWKDKSGEKCERTEWHKITVWGKQGESCGKYLSKGRQVYVEGILQTRDYEDKDGVKKYVTEVKAQNVTFLGSKNDQGQTDSGDIPF